MKILVVDDDIISLNLMSKILSKRGYETLEASNAKEALEFLRSGEPVSLIITDIIMPDMSGSDFLVHTRNEPALQHLPVIVCSSRGDRESVLDVLKKGAADFTVKPIVAESLLSKVENILMDTPAFEDMHKVIKRLNIDQDTYKEMLTTMKERIASALKEMQELINKNDFENLKILAISINGGAKSLGAERISSVLNTMEEVAQIQDADKAQSIMIALQRELTILSELCDTYSEDVKEPPPDSEDVEELPPDDV